MSQQTKSIARQPDQIIKNHFERAMAHRESFAIEAIITGQMILEAESDMHSPSSGTNFKVDNETAEPDPIFDEWATQLFGKSRSTLFRWRACSDRVMKFLLDKQPGDDPQIVLRQEPDVLISTILTASEDILKTLNVRAQSFREQFDAFMRDRTLAETTWEALEGLVHDKNITLAANGKEHGGDGGDRKDFPLFMARHLRVLADHCGHWDVMTQIQRTEAKEILRAFFVGDEIKLPGRRGAGAQVKFALLPAELREYAREAILEARKPRAVQD